MRVVYNSYNGRYSDSPRAIHAALLARGDAIEHLWLRDSAHGAGFPDGTASVPPDSDETVAALESADVIISNSHIELDWRKRRGATYIQTWHGTPLKRIHADVRWGPPGLLEHLSEDVDRWDVLVSPNSFSTEVLRRAFRWPGEVLEIGYPRNDLLVSRHASAVRERVRAELGIDDDTTAVLYTPTWRDDAFWEGAPDASPLALDVERFFSELGDDHVLLVRPHYKLTGRMRAVEHHAVRDVSFHPEIGDLYLAADLLVTDYSSTMFDFAITGKPLLFYTYDLARYRDELRGFYFDLEAEAPGPLVATTAELTAHIREIKAVKEQYDDRYARFRERFCHREDGRATQRFLDRFFPDPSATGAGTVQ